MVMFKEKDSEIVASRICLENISRDWSAGNMKKTGLNGYVYEFNVLYLEFNKLNITKSMSIIHKYLMSKYNIVQNVSVH